MNRIVREHYPASKLPDELRGSLPADCQVRVTVELQAESERRSVMEIIESAKHLRRGGVDPVRDVREGRDDRCREALHDRIRRVRA
jgi:hypothetical protein